MSVKPRIALIGAGRMGSGHLFSMSLLRNLSLCAICDSDPAVVESKRKRHRVPGYIDHAEMLEEVKPDGVIIATPHYDHTPIAVEALSRGIHVLVEKPVGVRASDVRKMIDAHGKGLKQNGDLVFAAMFQMRTQPHWIKIKKMIDQGALGRLMRASWIITDWFRNQAYYDQGGWRATWAGEGGGVLMNQAVHNLDLYQWLFGMPWKIIGHASLGKYHNIEVEDEVTGYFEHENGMVGHFITSTAEYPGTNRLEIVGEKGVLIIEKQKIVFKKNRRSVLEFSNTTNNAGGVPGWRYRRLFSLPKWDLHKTVVRNFADAVAGKAEPLAPAAEGLHSITLGNGLILSSINKEPLELPLDEAGFDKKLKTLIDESTFEKKNRKVNPDHRWS